MPSYSPGDTLLDKYIIQSLLGQGAFGEVYLVTHLMLGGAARREGAAQRCARDRKQ